MKAIIVNSCNSWKEYASFRLIGVFTNRKKLNRVLNTLIKQGDIDFNSDKKTVNHLTIKEMQVQLDYICIDEIELNKVQ